MGEDFIFILRSLAVHTQEDIPERQQKYGGGGGSLSRAQGWPRAAWYVRGMGRWGVEEVSEAPEKTPYRALGDMITKVGGPEVFGCTSFHL